MFGIFSRYVRNNKLLGVLADMILENVNLARGISVIECQKCKDKVWSRHRHDMRYCKCLAVAIDGGRSYTKISGDVADWKLMAMDLILTKEGELIRMLPSERI